MYSVMKKLMYFLMALVGFGFTSCDDGGILPAAPEYGCPHVNFSLKARVVDQSGEPIEGIKVQTGWIDGHTNQDGEIKVNGTVYPGDQYIAIFEDIDGEANGGEFETLRLDITDKVVQTEEGSGSWYDGAFKAELGDVTMVLKDSNQTENE